MTQGRMSQAVRLIQGCCCLKCYWLGFGMAGWAMNRLKIWRTQTSMSCGSLNCRWKMMSLTIPFCHGLGRHWPKWMRLWKHTKTPACPINTPDFFWKNSRCLTFIWIGRSIIPHLCGHYPAKPRLSMNYRIFAAVLCASKDNCRVFAAPGAIIPQAGNAKDVHYTRKVIAQHHQAEFPFGFFQAAHQKMVPPGPPFQSAERVLDQRPTLAHHALAVFHAGLVTFDNGLMFPTRQVSGGGFVGQTLAA